MTKPNFETPDMTQKNIEKIADNDGDLVACFNKDVSENFQDDQY